MPTVEWTKYFKPQAFDREKYIERSLKRNKTIKKKKKKKKIKKKKKKKSFYTFGISEKPLLTQMRMLLK